MQKKIDAANDSGVDLVAFKRQSCLMKRNERRGACRIDRHARSIQTEDMRNSVGNDRKCVAGHKMRTAGCGILHLEISAVQRRSTDINTDAFLFQLYKIDPCVFDRPPNRLKENALLRIHIGCFASGKAEQCWIKLKDIIDHAGRECVGFARNASGRMPEARLVPAIAWYRSDCAYLFPQKSQQFQHISRRGSDTRTPKNFDCHT